jgi:TfoX/Sxy family transcriptional regulator of competence genes
VAYNEDLAQRVRDVIATRDDVTEQRMFGSNCFLVRGNLAVCVRQDELLVRLDPEDAEKAITEEGVRVAEMGPQKRQMKGWVFVSAAAVQDEPGLAGWVDAGAGYAASLPPK